jgi:4-amino-4-deoxy-L-arabinose transferase-like glycosyltransferase
MVSIIGARPQPVYCKTSQCRGAGKWVWCGPYRGTPVLRKPGQLLTLACVAAFTVAWFSALASRMLFDPDEGRYAEIPREMLESGDYVVPHLDHVQYLEKPPLQYWLTALSFRLLGESEFAARLCTGIAGYCTLLLIYVLGRRIGGATFARRAVLFAIASPLFMLLGQQLTLDMLLCCSLTAAFACFMLAQLDRDDPTRCRNWMIGCWIAMALAVLTKGLIGILIPAASLLGYVLWQRDWAVLRTLSLRWGLSLFSLIAIPWFFLVARAVPSFLNFFFIREHFQRYLTPIEHRSQPWWFFVPVLLIGTLSWFCIAVTAVARTWALPTAQGRFNPARLAAVWCAFIFVLFSLSDAKLIPYILPMIPALALLAAALPENTLRPQLLIGSVLSSLAGTAILVCVNSTWQRNRIGAISQQAHATLTGIGVWLIAGSLLAALFAIKRHERAALQIASATWAITSFGILIGATQVQNLFSAKPLVDAMQLHSQLDGPVFSVGLYDQSFAFYLRKPVVLVSYRDELSPGLDVNPEMGIDTLEQFSNRWRSLEQGSAVMRPKTRDALAALGLPMREIVRARGRVVVARR